MIDASFLRSSGLHFKIYLRLNFRRSRRCGSIFFCRSISLQLPPIAQHKKEKPLSMFILSFGDSFSLFRSYLFWQMSNNEIICSSLQIESCSHIDAKVTKKLKTSHSSRRWTEIIYKATANSLVNTQFKNTQMVYGLQRPMGEAERAVVMAAAAAAAASSNQSQFKSFDGLLIHAKIHIHWYTSNPRLNPHRHLRIKMSSKCLSVHEKRECRVLSSNNDKDTRLNTSNGTYKKHRKENHLWLSHSIEMAFCSPFKAATKVFFSVCLFFFSYSSTSLCVSLSVVAVLFALSFLWIYFTICLDLSTSELLLLLLLFDRTPSICLFYTHNKLIKIHTNDRSNQLRCIQEENGIPFIVDFKYIIYSCFTLAIAVAHALSFIQLIARFSNW